MDGDWVPIAVLQQCMPTGKHMGRKYGVDHLRFRIIGLDICFAHQVHDDI